MTKDQTQQEKRATADAAKAQATEARAAANAAPDDEALKTAATEAEAEATRLESEAAAPSHEPKPGLSKIEKMQRRRDIIDEQIKTEKDALGIQDDADDDDDDVSGDDDDDDDTKGDAKIVRVLQKQGLIKTAEQMAGEITDTDLRAAVLTELRFITKGVPAADRYSKALSIASSSKNQRVAAEAARMAERRPRDFGSGGGSPPKNIDDGEFKPTPLEAAFMKKHKLSKEDVLASRAQAASFDFGGDQK